MPYLADDIYSMMNPSKLYAKKGTKVDIISDRGGIFIVKPEGCKDGFHVLRNELSDEPITSAPDAPGSEQLEQKKTAAVRRSRRPQHDPGPDVGAGSQQGSLF